MAVGALHQCTELFQAIRRILRQIRIYIVVILHRIGASRPALHHIRVVVADAIGGIIADNGMVRHTGVPDVRNAHRPDLLQRLIIDVVELAHPVLFNGSPGFVSGVGVAV